MPIEQLTLKTLKCPFCESDNVKEIDYEAGVTVFECNNCHNVFNRFLTKTKK